MGLPAATFGSIAVDCHVFADRERFGLSAMEWFGAGVKVAAPGVARVIEDTRRSADTAAALSDLFRRLAPYEVEVRAYLEALMAEAV